MDQPANDPDDGVPGFATVQALADENRRLKAEIGRLETHVFDLEKLALLDPLVGLPNRRSVLRDLEHVIARLNRRGGSAAMIFVDVDGLKQINDRFGHPTGDAALIKVAQILFDNVRSGDTVARLSGDEFIVLLTDVDELGAWNMALRLVEATVAAPCNINNCLVPLSIAVGVSAITGDDRPFEVISRADQAMYSIKSVR